jgi:hypothetical protein
MQLIKVTNKEINRQEIMRLTIGSAGRVAEELRHRNTAWKPASDEALKPPVEVNSGLSCINI